MGKITQTKNPSFSLSLFQLLIFIPPFLSGLFFDNQWTNYQIVIWTVAALILVFLRKGDVPILVTPMDYANFLLVLAYIISLMVAINVNGAIITTFKVLSYFLVYLLATYLVRSKKDLLAITKVIYWSGIGVVLLTLGAAFESWSYPTLIVNGRLASTLEYPNAFAAFTACLFFIGYYFTKETEQKKGKRLIYESGNFLLLVGFMGAQSRGGLITLGIVLLMYIIVLPKEYKRQFVTRFAYQAVLAYVFINYGSLLSWLALVCFTIMSLLPVIMDRFLSITTKKAYLYLALAGVAILLFTFANSHQSSLQEVSKLEGDRLANINISSGTAMERIAFYEDALRISKDNPLGTGGRGWEALYPQYQKYRYQSTEIHNHYLQILVEAGILGFLAFAFVWVTIFMTIKELWNYSGESKQKLLVTSISAAVLILGVHSFLDFNLSIPAIALIFWILLGCLNGMQKRLVKEHIKFSWKVNLSYRYWKPVLLFGLAIIISISVLEALSLNHLANGKTKFRDRLYGAAKEEFQRAVNYNPLSSEANSALAETIWNINTKAAEQQNTLPRKEEPLSLVDKAISLEPYNSKYRLLKGKLLLGYNQVDKAVFQLELANKYSPLEQRYYDYLAQVYFNAGKHYVKSEKGRAKGYLTKATELEAKLTGIVESLPPNYRILQRSELTLAASQDIIRYGKLAEELLKTIETN